MTELAATLKEKKLPPTLQVIVIGRNRLENVAAEQLAKTITAHSESLTQLILPQNGIRPEGIAVLAKSLAECTNLDTLDLQDNTFTQVGSAAFAEAVTHGKWLKLKTMNIGDCLLGETGSEAVWRALQATRLPALETVNFQYNEMSEKGALIVAQAVIHMKELKSLWLNGNSFNPDGTAAEAIKSSLERSGREEILDEWDDMEFDGDDEEESDAEEAVVRKGVSADDLAHAVEKLSV